MIDTQEALQALVDRARQAEAVALDTEFVWERTYYPRLGVVQVGLAEDDVHLLDAVALDLAPLGELLADPSVVKILHDAPQDLVILRRATGASPRNVFDTQRASGFVGLSATISLQDLITETAGLTLPKGSQRSNWLARPLSEQQTKYALNDVRHMPAARRIILDRAEARGRRAWVDDEMQRYEDAELYEESPPDEAARVKGRGLGGLSPRQRAVLDDLGAWREAEARRRDLPRRRVLDDEVLIETARRMPDSLDGFSVRGTPDKVLYRHADDLLAAVQRVRALPNDALPKRTPLPPDEDRLQAATLLLQAFVAGRCEREAMDPQLVATKADLRAFVDDGADASSDAHPVLRGWRHDFIGEALQGLLRGEVAVTLDPADGWPRRA